MFMTLRTFFTLRANFAEAAGTSLKEREMSFGQILAFATWLPIILDFIIV